MTSYDKHKKIWSGPKKELTYHPDRSIGEIIFKSLRNYPNNVLQISDSEGTTLKNHEALTAAIRIAQHLKTMGLRNDDVIGIVGLNTTYLMPLAVACMFNCTPFHGVNGGYDEESMKSIFGLTKPKLLFCDSQYYEKVRAATNSFKPKMYTIFGRIEGVPSVLDMLEPTKTETTYKPQPLSHHSAQTMAILCSSGTTGMPKAICVPNTRMLVNSIDFFTNEHVFFTINSIDWIIGVWCIVANCIYGSKRIITHLPFSPEYYAELVERHKINAAVLTPPLVTALTKCPKVKPESMAYLRYFFVAGDGISLETLKKLHDLTKNALIEFVYGTCEVGNATVNFAGPSASVGKLSAGMRARIVDDNGKSLGPNEVGELYLDNGEAWNGYYGNPKESLRHRDIQGWFHTGDSAYFDDDQLLYIVDRKKDILRYFGLQAWPSEIEKCIKEMPEVEDVCVVSIYDESCGDKAGALVVKSASAGHNFSEQDVKDYLQKKLNAMHKQLNAGVLFVDKVPLSPNGKVLRRKAKEQFLASYVDKNRI